MQEGRLNYDVAVIGAGIAGLSYVLDLDPSYKVGLFCKGETVGGASNWAQGGLAAVVDNDDSVDEHISDTLNVGCGLCDTDAVAQIVARGHDAVEWLESHDVQFTKQATGDFDLSHEGGHGKRRIVHALDNTGAAIVNSLATKVAKLPNVTIHPYETAIDLVVNDAKVSGFYSLNRTSNQVTTVTAKSVALATGGVGKVYRYTTNPDVCTGDGIAMAWRVGCEVVNMEFVQFHPTTLFHPYAKSVLISEACRGDGSLLVTKTGHRFMQDYHPKAELAPRDVVARAIDAEIKRSGDDCVFLDFAPVGVNRIAKKFPTIYKRCLELGIDITKQKVPVVPSAHYLCGGVATNTSGETSVKGLFAIGETAHTGLHGANRLASNSLLECITVARASAVIANRGLNDSIIEPPLWDSSRVGPSHEEVMVAHNWDEIRRMMWNYVGIVRSDERLARAHRRIELIAEEVDEHYKRFVVSSDFIELRNLLVCAQLIIQSASQRRESRGLHYNIDCPTTAKKAYTTILKKDHSKTSVLEQLLHAN